MIFLMNLQRSGRVFTRERLCFRRTPHQACKKRKHRFNGPESPIDQTVYKSYPPHSALEKGAEALKKGEMGIRETKDNNSGRNPKTRQIGYSDSPYSFHNQLQANIKDQDVSCLFQDRLAYDNIAKYPCGKTHRQDTDSDPQQHYP